MSNYELMLTQPQMAACKMLSDKFKAQLLTDDICRLTSPHLYNLSQCTRVHVCTHTLPTDVVGLVRLLN